MTDRYAALRPESTFEDFEALPSPESAPGATLEGAGFLHLHFFLDDSDGSCHWAGPGSQPQLATNPSGKKVQAFLRHGDLSLEFEAVENVGDWWVLLKVLLSPGTRNEVPVYFLYDVQDAGSRFQVLQIVDGVSPRFSLLSGVSKGLTVVRCRDLELTEAQRRALGDVLLTAWKGAGHDTDETDKQPARKAANRKTSTVPSWSFRPKVQDLYSLEPGEPPKPGVLVHKAWVTVSSIPDIDKEPSAPMRALVATFLETCRGKNRKTGTAGFWMLDNSYAGLSLVLVGPAEDALIVKWAQSMRQHDWHIVEAGDAQCPLEEWNALAPVVGFDGKDAFALATNDPESHPRVAWFGAKGDDLRALWVPPTLIFDGFPYRVWDPTAPDSKPKPRPRKAKKKAVRL